MDVAGQKVFYNIVLKLLSKKKKIVVGLVMLISMVHRILLSWAAM
jgi:hypothetical protein